MSRPRTSSDVSATMDHCPIRSAVLALRTRIYRARWDQALADEAGDHQTAQEAGQAEQTAVAELTAMLTDLEPRISALEDITDRAYMRLCVLMDYTPEEVATLPGASRTAVYRHLQHAEEALAG